MPQFTDPPYFLLKNFFDGQQVPGTPPELVIDTESFFWQDFIWQDWEDWKWKDFNFWSWVRWVIYTQAGWSDGGTLKGHYNSGLAHGISARGGAGTELWVLTPGSNVQFKKIKLVFEEINGNFFKFFKNHLIETQDWEAGSSVFFRKNSLFHEWLRKQRIAPNPTVDRTVERYANTQRPFLFFGSIFPIGSPSLSGDQSYNIEFYGMKDWTVDALPQHNQTERIIEIFNLFFDRLYHEAYQGLKEVNTLLDPIEVDINYLGLITELFNVTLIEELPDELRKRQFTQSIINWLKRKGTYSSIYSIFRIMLGNTVNRLNIYERWHRYKNPAGTAMGDPTITGPVLPYFEDYNYLGYYGEDVTIPTSGACSNGVGSEYYDNYGSANYPDTFGLPTTGAPASAGKYLSPHYKVEMDLSCEPLGTNFIIDQETIESLLDYWELVRPVARVSHYRYLLSPVTDFLGEYVPLYSAEYSAIMNSLTTTPVIEPDEGGAILIQVFNKQEWDFYHGLGTENVIVQAYDRNFNLLYPSEIVVEDANSVTVKFDKPVGGQAFAYLRAVPSFTQAVPATLWNVVHGQGQKEVLSQFDHEFPERRKIIPKRVTLIDNNTLEAEFDDARDGYALYQKADYIHQQTFATKTWTIQHDLEVQGVQVQVFDNSFNQIMPTSVTLLDANTAQATFNVPLEGYALVKAVGLPLTQEAVIDLIEPDGYIKLGNGDDLDIYNPVFNNDLKSPIYTIYWPNFTVTRLSNLYYIDTDAQATSIDGNITEIGIFNREDDLIFYTQCDPIYKPTDVGITLHYRIRK